MSICPKIHAELGVRGYAPDSDFTWVLPQEPYFEPINWYRTKPHEPTHWAGQSWRP